MQSSVLLHAFGSSRQLQAADITQQRFISSEPNTYYPSASSISDSRLKKKKFPAYPRSGGAARRSEGHQFTGLFKPHLHGPSGSKPSSRNAQATALLSPHSKFIESPSTWLPHDARQGWPAAPRQGTQGPHWLPHLQVSNGPSAQSPRRRDPIHLALENLAL